MPCEQTPWKPTPGPSGTQWSENLFHSKQQYSHLLILNFNSSELTLPPFVEPSQYNEPPIPGLSQSYESQVPSHEDAMACEPEPEVAPRQSMEDPFGKFPFSFFPCPQHSLTPPSTISSSSCYPPLHNHH
ncbi:hypothetical protein O181_031857 [Austropuccinia psidii MF-1]|uniref:Uncharacterized protein n=1 Tax=Austropuccinia psidii MF-1 TaxID=1389203 RepID=A0A9Q3CYF3_9BASI|nr:hypothetical protein [Austropuccinia psidii MF-1]